VLSLLLQQQTERDDELLLLYAVAQGLGRKFPGGYELPAERLADQEETDDDQSLDSPELRSFRIHQLASVAHGEVIET
jgi:hypothetical protein